MAGAQNYLSDMREDASLYQCAITNTAHSISFKSPLALKDQVHVGALSCRSLPPEGGVRFSRTRSDVIRLVI